MNKENEIISLIDKILSPSLSKIVRCFTVNHPNEIINS